MGPRSLAPERMDVEELPAELIEKAHRFLSFVNPRNDRNHRNYRNLTF